jgi:hypothetical protein
MLREFLTAIAQITEGQFVPLSSADLLKYVLREERREKELTIK